MATLPVSDKLIHVENNVILTTKDKVRVQEVFNYLSDNLDKFRVNSEFVVVCGIHTSEKGEMKHGENGFKDDYETMFNWCNNETCYNNFSDSPQFLCHIFRDHSLAPQAPH